VLQFNSKVLIQKKIGPCAGCAIDWRDDLIEGA